MKDCTGRKLCVCDSVVYIRQRNNPKDNTQVKLDLKHGYVIDIKRNIARVSGSCLDKNGYFVKSKWIYKLN